jgi:hypothetical protein
MPEFSGKLKIKIISTSSKAGIKDLIMENYF